MIAMFNFFLPSCSFFLECRLRIVDPVMMNSGQDLIEAPCYLMEIFQSKFALVKLAVNKDVVDDLLNEALNPCGSGIDKCSGSSFDVIGKKDETGLSCLGFRAVVTEIVLADYLPRSGLFNSFLIKILYQGSTVRLPYDIGDRVSKPVLLRQLGPFFDMGDKYESTHARREFVVAVFTDALILYEVLRLAYLPDIMIIGSNPCQ